MGECKWNKDEICVNADCPMVADYCPVPNDPEVCRFEDRMDEEEIAEIKWAIELIDDYVREPNSISAEWYKVLKLCRRALREKAMKESK